MKPKLLATLSLSLFTTASMLAQTYVVMVKPQGSKEWGYMKTDGSYAIEPKYRKCAPFSEESLAIAQNPKNKEYQFVNLSGEPLATEVTDFALQSSFGFGLKGFSDGLAGIGKDKKWGYIGTDGKIAIPLKYDNISPFDNGHAIVELNDKYMVIDTKGNETPINAKAKVVKDMKEGLAPFATEEKKEGFISPSGEILIEPKFSRVGYFNGGLAWARNAEGKIGFINVAGEWVIQPQFDAVKDFPKEGNLARVKLNDKWTFVNRTGEIKDLGVADVQDFSEGLAYGKTGEKVGFYNEAGEWIIKPQFEAVRDFKNGYAAAKQNGAWGVIDKTGVWVVQPKFDGIKDVEKVN
ncbi:hypothetical protein Oweho_0770 [Owenweeksia hongkongensis DSM 17368]|uniref:KWG repeat protein n=1 Tax=Owenweeksia hongkongensis (strain DSM 17368 / CIP 108786 / JCM 12287 / NRRL B-23963 / UST20020801) TaxID=926562 RepID=G8R233_OWEHD|nr:WG repeat-containing protein [Owenweeksia hongkongensis]AEV31783.1 hypothetical protein Oweho_0770 [Owenweeksia hongkongensis DSM 17368]